MSMSETIRDSAARTLWLLRWADAEEEQGHTYPGVEIDDIAPDTPDWCRQYATRLCVDTAGQNGLPSIGAVFDEFSLADDEEAAERFGHCLAMQSDGQGVGMIDYAHEWKSPAAARIHVPRTLEGVGYWPMECGACDGEGKRFVPHPVRGSTFKDCPDCDGTGNQAKVRA